MMLENIIKTKKEQVERLKERLIKSPFDLKQPPEARDFYQAISRKGINLIAEIKQRSPSAGVIISKYDPAKIARIYEKNGASAISVLTDTAYFNGKIEDIMKVKNAVKLPVLRKDFIVDEVQIYESFFAGADAILLIARILRQDQLGAFIKTANGLKMTALVEVRSEEEAKAAIYAGADVIGINNRDLDTLKTELDTTIRIIERIPELKEKILVSESGIIDKNDIERFSNVGVNAVLVGEAILKSKDMGQKIRELTS